MKYLKTRAAGISLAVIQAIAMIAFTAYTGNYVAAWGYICTLVIAYQPGLKDILDKLSDQGPKWLEYVVLFLAKLPDFLKNLFPPAPPGPPPPHA